MKNSAADIPVILYVSGFADIAGGGQRSFLLLLKSLDRSRFRPLVICPAPGEVSRELAGLGIETAFLEQPRLRTWRFWRVAAYLLALRRAAAAAGAFLAHCDTLNSALLSGLAFAGTGIRIIFHARVADDGGILDHIVPLFCDRIICVSKAVAIRFQGANDRIRVIYNSVDIDVFSPFSPGAAGQGRPVLGYCGQLVREKGLFDLLDAFKLVLNEFPAAVLRLAGRGPLENGLKDRIKALDMEGSVSLCGFTDDVSGFLAGLNVFVSPTRHYEGLSRGLIEAMACGLPVITTPLGGNPETVVDGETGFMVPPGDVEALSGKIALLLRDRALAQKMGAGGRARAVALFDSRKAAAALHALYGELLNGNEPGKL